MARAPPHREKEQIFQRAISIRSHLQKGAWRVIGLVALGLHVCRRFRALRRCVRAQELRAARRIVPRVRFTSRKRACMYRGHSAKMSLWYKNQVKLL